MSPAVIFPLSFQRKKRFAPEAPAEDQQADPAMYVNSWYGYPYSAYGYARILKKREAPAEAQQADSNMFHNNAGGGIPPNGRESADMP